MKALITGASSGIGLEMAKYLATMNYELILVGRNKEKLEELQKGLNVSSQIVLLDLSDTTKVKELYVLMKNENIDILINNAGYGLLGEFDKTDLEKELNMIDLNIKSVHVLTKLFLKDFIKKDSGYILNVASAAAFGPGPLMATYYSSKSYVYNLTLAIYGELKKKKSNVHISCLCPGPVDTNFNNVANCEFKSKSLSSFYVARYTLEKMFKNKLLIIPGVSIKLLYIFGRLIPIKPRLNFTYNIQHNKNKN